MKPRVFLAAATFLLSVCYSVGWASPTAHMLTPAQVVKLADARASAEHYDLRYFTRKEPAYDVQRKEWSVFYAGKPESDHGRPVIAFGNDFIVYVADKTKQTRLMPGR